MASTICCLNPDCSKPENPDGMKYCSNCGRQIFILRHHYRPLKLLSDEGGFGRTYLAEDLDKLNEICVIKQLAPKQQGTATANKVQQLFDLEARQLQQLGEHPQIPQLLAYFEENGYFYLVQQYIKGKTLDKLPQPWKENEIRNFLNDILPVLEFVHQKQVIHRDIKPANIIRRDADGKYILIDFGASKEFQATVATRGTIIGTQGYAAYEQMESGETYQASDLFSLGATCFHLLTGVDPYTLLLDQGYQWVNQWQKHLQSPINPKSQEILAKLLQKDRKDRYQSALEVTKVLSTGELTQIQTQTQITPKKEPTNFWRWWRKNPNFPLQTLDFETAYVDSQGNIIKREIKQAQSFSLNLGNNVSLEMVKITGGRFWMGSPASEVERGNDERQQEITVSDFSIGKYEVTQEQWQTIRGNNPSYFKKGGKYPVENVSWHECQEFCQKLSQKTGLDFRLSTETEWEYACRACTTTPFYFGETLSTMIANYYGNSTYNTGKKGTYRGKTTEVGSFPANAFGLYDMHGNVWEWCQDDYDSNSQYKVLRGGSWLNYPRLCRSAARNRYEPDGKNFVIGFRIVLVTLY